jgi:hypothetical protein
MTVGFQFEKSRSNGDGIGERDRRTGSWYPIFADFAASKTVHFYTNARDPPSVRFESPLLFQGIS